jgi:hypothetical protein
MVNEAFKDAKVIWFVYYNVTMAELDAKHWL